MPGEPRERRARRARRSRPAARARRRPRTIAAVVEHQPVAVAQRGRAAADRAGTSCRFSPVSTTRRRWRSSASSTTRSIALARTSHACRRLDRGSRASSTLHQNRKYRCAIGSTSAGSQVAARRRRAPRRSPDRPRSSASRRCGSCSSCEMLARVLDRDELLLDAELVARARLCSRRLRHEHHRRRRAAPCRRRRTSAGSAPAAASGSRRWDRPSARRRSMPPLMISRGLTPKNAGDHSTRSASLPFSIEPMCLRRRRARSPGLIVYLAT